MKKPLLIEEDPRPLSQPSVTFEAVGPPPDWLFSVDRADDFPSRWIEALAAIDVRGDKEPLLALLRSNEELTPRALAFITDMVERHTLKRKEQLLELLGSGGVEEARGHIADVLDLCDLKRKRGRPRVPAYTSSDAEHRMGAAVYCVMSMRRKGISRAEAIQRTAELFRTDQRMIEAAYSGRRGSLRKRRRP